MSFQTMATVQELEVLDQMEMVDPIPSMEDQMETILEIVVPILLTEDQMEILWEMEDQMEIVDPVQAIDNKMEIH